MSRGRRRAKKKRVWGRALFARIIRETRAALEAALDEAYAIQYPTLRGLVRLERGPEVMESRTLRGTLEITPLCYDAAFEIAAGLE